MSQVELDAIDVLKERLVELQAESEGVIATADSAKRSLTDDEQKQIDDFNAEFDRTTKSIASREKVNSQKAALAETQGRKTEPMPVRTNAPVPQEAHESKPTQRQTKVPATPMGDYDRRWSWRSFGEFACGVRDAGLHGGRIDPRLEARAPTTWGSEGVGADGGHAVPPDFRDEILSKIGEEDSIYGRTDQLISSTNTMQFPTDEDAPWSTGGITAYWDGEGVVATQSKPLLQQKTVQLNKLRVLVPVSDELLEDAPAMGAYLRKKAPQKMRFKIDLAVVQGTGSGQPLGILNSGCLISVAKESAQTADTVVFNNITKMWSRMYSPSRATSVWLINQDIEPQLLTMSFEGTSSSVPAYMPANGLSATPYATLMGRPVLPTQACETLGDKGDIILADLGQYLTASKSGGIRAETSIHLWFDYDMTAFKFVIRLAGQPWWSAALSPRDGSNTLSPFVTLAERA